MYGGVATNEVESAKKRIFALQRLDADVVEALNPRVAKKDKENDDMDEEDFLQEVEADKEMRSRMNLYKSEYIARKLVNNEEIKVEGEADDDESIDDQEVRLDELLDGLVLDGGTDSQANGLEKVMEMEEDENGDVLLEEGERAAKDGLGFIQKDDARNMQTKEAAVPVGNSFDKEFMDKKYNFL